MKSTSGRSRVALTTSAALAVAAYAWSTTGLRPFTGPALGAVLAGGIAAIAIGAALGRHGPTDRPVRARAGTAAWLILLVAAVAWEVAAYFQRPRSEHPTLSSLANGAFGSHPVRALALVAWLVLGVRIVRR